MRTGACRTSGLLRAPSASGPMPNSSLGGACSGLLVVGAVVVAVALVAAGAGLAGLKTENGARTVAVPPSDRSSTAVRACGPLSSSLLSSGRALPPRVESTSSKGAMPWLRLVAPDGEGVSRTKRSRATPASGLTNT